MAYNKKPDLSHLTDNDYLRIMDKGFKSVPKLIEAIHFILRNLKIKIFIYQI